MADNIEVIDEEGDVVLVVGSIEPKKLRVSSAMLSRASPVFKALFGPHFGEGQTKRSPESPVEIALPDDNPVGMTRLCDLIHLRKVLEHAPNASFSYCNLQFAIVADKYDVVDKLQLQSQGLLFGWLDKFSSRKSREFVNMNSYGNMLAASYLLDSPRAFEEVSLRFINQGYPTVSSLLKELCGQMLPAKVLLFLQERRNADGTATRGLCLTCVRADADISVICTKH